MSRPAKSRRYSAGEVEEIASLAANIAAGKTDPNYRPTITEWPLAEVFDKVMASLGLDVRAWRGSAHEKTRGVR
jgi:hypothetical protein